MKSSPLIIYLLIYCTVLKLLNRFQIIRNWGSKYSRDLNIGTFGMNIPEINKLRVFLGKRVLIIINIYLYYQFYYI